MGASLPHAKICTAFLDIKTELSMLVVADTELKSECRLSDLIDGDSIKALG